MAKSKDKSLLTLCSQITFISAFVIFEAGSLICGAAQSSVMFIIGRAISGAGGAGILNGGFTIIAAAAPLEARPSICYTSSVRDGLLIFEFLFLELIGILLGIASTGVAIGPLIGGALTQHAGWRWCWLLDFPLPCSDQA